MYRNYIINEKDSIKNQIKNFDDFKNKFREQKRIKKKILKQIFLSGKKNINKSEIKEDKKENISKIKKDDDKIIEIEFSNGQSIKEKLSVLKKYSNSVLAAYFISEENIPKKNGHIFFDRESKDFKNLLYYMENNKLPKFKDNLEEKKFFREINYWKIPLHISSKKTLKFNHEFCPYFFNLDKNKQILTKSNLNHGIILLNKKLNALNPYIEFTISSNNIHQNKKILLALVEENKIEKNNLNKSFENNLPFIFYWDLFHEKLVKSYKNYFNKYEFHTVELNKFCRCYKNNYEIKYGLIYNHQEHTVELIRDDVKLDILIQNIEPDLIPAFEIHMENCRIKLSSKNEFQEKFFL